MDFERGIWQTSLDGDVNRVRKLLHKGRDPNSREETLIQGMAQDIQLW